MARYAKANGTSALLVIRGGDIVLERYWGASHDTMIDSQSMAKSFLALAVGLAVDDGDLHLTDTVRQWYPALSSTWGSVTLQYLMQMRSGIDINNTDQYTAMQATSDWGAYVMGRPINKAPGTWWRYKADPQVVSNMLTLATGKSAWDLLQERVLTPIGVVAQFTWARDPTGHNDGNGGVETTAEHYARVGFLMLNDGEWDGVQLLSKSWIDQVHAPCQYPGWEFANEWQAAGQAYTAANEYGLFWWCRKWSDSPPTTPQDAYYAFGGGGQFLIVVPSLDVVVVRLGNGPTPYPDGVFLQTLLRKLQLAAQ